MANASANQSRKNFYNPFENIPNLMDLGSMRQQFSKNIEAWTEINQAILDVSREAARRATEVIQMNAQCIYDCSREAIASKNPVEAQNRQAEMITSIMDNTFAQVKESADISSKAAKKISDVYNKRASEILSECCGK